MLLCDAAESVAGKLYILGGGWTLLHTTTPPAMALAIKLEVPWERAGEPLAIKAALLTASGAPWRVEGEAVEAGGEVALGTPPGLDETRPLDVVFVMRIAGLVLDPGGYSWRLTVADEHVAEAAFRVLDA
jgi:hypothetical protein